MALVGLGLSSMIDGSASAVLIWRFHVERRNPDRSERVESAARRLLAVTLLVVAAYIVGAALLSLATRRHPDDTNIGVYLTAASLLVLPLLAVAKVRLAAHLHSRALRADGVLVRREPSSPLPS